MCSLLLICGIILRDWIWKSRGSGEDLLHIYTHFLGSSELPAPSIHSLFNISKYLEVKIETTDICMFYTLISLEHAL